MWTETLLFAIFVTTSPEANRTFQDPTLCLLDISSLDLIEHGTPLLSLSVMQDEQEIPENRYERRFATQGADRWSLQSAFATHEAINTLTDLGFGLEFFIFDDLSISTEFNGSYISQDDKNAAGVNFNLLFRWYFHHEDLWSYYIEGGAGFLWTTHDVPARGSDFNFVPQAAIGISLAMENSSRLNLSIGWHHISNADLFENNPGRDSLILHLGMSFPF